MRMSKNPKQQQMQLAGEDMLSLLDTDTAARLRPAAVRCDISFLS
eukprot:CAMPEP_0117681884 /NCGR_PEP_ID=MMETSP0804-20121206/19271_1 /TAXON_ID=1074897 /ORGANISM="Tetraselmis astigmatica, Strain CCMP880" /LENGTH=44 /DNA_ID= /DNA_START= /DNA_END= /DNA_ORIENTATION=